MTLSKELVKQIDALLGQAEADGRNVLFEQEAYQILEWLGFDVPKWCFVTSEDELAKALTEEANFDSKKAVLKIVSRDIQHKSDIGGVVICENTPGIIKEKYTNMIQVVKEKEPSAKLEGVLIMECLEIVNEILLSLMNDKQFRHVLTLGLGGTFTELYKDIEMRLVPASREELATMAPRLLTYPLIQGYRGRPGVDEDKLLDAMDAINQLAENFSKKAGNDHVIEEFEINPLASTPDGRLCPIDSILRFSKRGVKPNVTIMGDCHEALTNLFYAKRIALIGASDQEQSVGRGIMETLQQSNVEIIPINPKRDEIFGLKAYKSVTEVPGKINAAVVAIAAKHCLNAIKECVAKEIPAVVLMSGGFGEMGDEGKEVEQQILDELAKGPTRVIGPNCLGIYSDHNKLSTFFLNPEQFAIPKDATYREELAVLSQSGAIAVNLMEIMRNVAAAKLVSFGNMMDLDVTTLIRYMNLDEKVKVIAVYVEGLKRGRFFFDNINNIETPVVVLKGGRSPEGSKATMSHTGAIAGDYKVLQCAMEQANVVEAGDLMEFGDFTKAFVFMCEKKVKGLRTAIISNAGGSGVTAADEIRNTVLQLAEYSDSAKATIRENMGGYVQLNNPTDIGGSSTDLHFIAAVEALCEDDNVDNLVVMPGFEPVSINVDRLVDNLITVYKKYDKPMVVSFSYFRTRFDLVDKLENHGIAVYPMSERAVRSMDAFVKYHMRKQGHPLYKLERKA